MTMSSLEFYLDVNFDVFSSSIISGIVSILPDFGLELGGPELDWARSGKHKSSFESEECFERDDPVIFPSDLSMFF